MNKLLFLDSYSSSYYGAQQSMLALGGLLHERGYDITVGSSADGVLLDRAEQAGLDVLLTPVPKHCRVSVGELSVLGRLYYLISILFCWCGSILHIRKLKKFDVICVNDIRMFLFYFPVLVFFHSKVIWYVRIREKNWVLCYLFGVISRKVVLVSSSLSDLFPSFLQFKVKVVNTGFVANPSVDVRAPLFDGVRFVTVGSINNRKNQKEVIRLFEIISRNLDKYATLDIYGDCDSGCEQYFNELKDIVVSNEYLKERVCFRGFSEKITEVLPSYDVFLFCSVREGLPRVLIEALMAGLFLVTRNVEGVSDIVINQSMGMVYDVISNFEAQQKKNVNNMIVHLGSLDRKRRSEFVVEKFSPERFVSRFVDVLA